MSHIPPPQIEPHETRQPSARGIHHYSDHLANERTFLAWTRTSISMIGLGFVVAKFSVWLRQFADRLEPNAPHQPRGYSMPLGLALMGLGIALMWIGYWRYRNVARAIENNQPVAAHGTAMAVSVVVAVIGIALMAYMMISY
jgi:putative membrane protein